MTTELVHFDKAKQELAIATDIDEVKEIRDKAEALRQYVKQQGATLEMQNQCAEIKIRAERRAGELLGEQEKNPGVRMRGPNIVLGPETPTLADLGITYMQSHRWQAEASVPEERFERHHGVFHCLDCEGIHLRARACLYFSGSWVTEVRP